MSVLIHERLGGGQISLLKINRPGSMNALNTELALNFIEALDEIEKNKEVRVIVITAEGDKSFCAGGDLKERKGMTEEQWFGQHRIFQEMYRRIRENKRPVLSVVNGFALGGGCELALNGDFIYAVPSAKFGLPEVKLGIIPGVGGTQTIGRFLPRAVALELLLTGDFISSDDALHYGMVNKVAPKEEIMDYAIGQAKKIAANSPLAVRSAKKAFTKGLDMPLGEGVDYALQLYARLASNEDRNEGVNAFNEKRKPKFKDVIE
ncbi:enoyl-CoA hydratase/isomerase family protein [Virgibacillus byunsanensis]|uniref:Enoyl-CoA hydratase/isomerase family protein n=1 Tax=Virgibacillus byunsanensis TaxID=570945 RepID=A0ABW3LG00_9BACI